MEQVYKEYPVGIKVRLEGDYPGDPPREIAGYRHYGINGKGS